MSRKGYFWERRKAEEYERGGWRVVICFNMALQTSSFVSFVERNDKIFVHFSVVSV